VKLIVARSTKKPVIACRTYQQIIASPAENHVVAQFPVELVVAGSTPEDVGAGSPIGNTVDLRVVDEKVIPGIAVKVNAGDRRKCVKAITVNNHAIRFGLVTILDPQEGKVEERILDFHPVHLDHVAGRIGVDHQLAAIEEEIRRHQPAILEGLEKQVVSLRGAS
jgi:hypothetical protein